MQCAQLFASLQNSTDIVLNARRLCCLLIHKFTYLLQYKCMRDRDVIPATTLRTQSQAQRPPSAADRDLLPSNTASGGGPIAFKLNETETVNLATTY